MTDNKLEKKISKDMLDDFMSDDDKQHKPQPKPTYSRGASYAGGGYPYGQRSFLDDDSGPDPMDPGYDSRGRSSYSGGSGRGGYSKPAPAYNPNPNKYGRNKDYKIPPTPYTPRPTGHAAYMDSSCKKVADVMHAADVRLREVAFVELEEADLNRVVDLLMKEVGDRLEEANIIWSSNATRVMRSMLRDTVLTGVYFDGVFQKEIRLEKQDDFDPETGEVYQ